MNTRLSVIFALTISTVAFTVTAHASNTSFFGHSALSFFTKDDMRLSKAAQIDALNHYQDGQLVRWANPKTGTHGVFAPFHTTYRQGEICRNLKILSTAHLVHEKVIYRFCRQQNEWKIM